MGDVDDACGQIVIERSLGEPAVPAGPELVERGPCDESEGHDQVRDAVLTTSLASQPEALEQVRVAEQPGEFIHGDTASLARLRQRRFREMPRVGGLVWAEPLAEGPDPAVEGVGLDAERFGHLLGRDALGPGGEVGNHLGVVGEAPFDLVRAVARHVHLYRSKQPQPGSPDLRIRPLGEVRVEIGISRQRPLTGASGHLR